MASRSTLRGLRAPFSRLRRSSTRSRITSTTPIYSSGIHDASSRGWAVPAIASTPAHEKCTPNGPCQHFFLYDDVTPALLELAARNVKVGLITNSHRSLASFQ